jgi:hypothetical protein
MARSLRPNPLRQFDSCGNPNTLCHRFRIAR